LPRGRRLILDASLRSCDLVLCGPVELVGIPYTLEEKPHTLLGKPVAGTRYGTGSKHYSTPFRFRATCPCHFWCGRSRCICSNMQVVCVLLGGPPPDVAAKLRHRRYKATPLVARLFETAVCMIEPTKSGCARSTGGKGFRAFSSGHTWDMTAGPNSVSVCTKRRHSLCVDWDVTAGWTPFRGQARSQGSLTLTLT
jgi:hypothetical protein